MLGCRSASPTTPARRSTVRRSSSCALWSAPASWTASWPTRTASWRSSSRASAVAATIGLEVVSVGIRDIILPGEMKDLLNKVTEAKKAAEANLIVRREETAAMRSQANTAKLLQDNPTLMRLRELEVLEKVAATAKLNVVLGDKGLTERIVNVL